MISTEQPEEFYQRMDKELRLRSENPQDGYDRWMRNEPTLAERRMEAYR